MTTQPKVDLSVVVAAYNEEPVIRETIRRILAELETRADISWELLVVNDGSRDRTGALLDELHAADPRLTVLHHRRNFGQGRALRTAFDICRGDTIVTLDADLSYGPEYIFQLYDELHRRNVEIALASAYMKGGGVQNVPFYRLMLSRVGNAYFARMSGYKIATSTCVVRAYRREVLDTLPLTSDGMELQLEILMKAHTAGFRVCEIPAQLHWSSGKAQAAGISRVSKMRILQSIRLYLLMGWLARPAFLFMGLAVLLLLPGTYMAVILSRKVILAIWRHIPEDGFLLAISSGLSEVFNRYSYSMAFCGLFLLVGIQVFAFALLFLQNKFYFDELSRLHQLSSRASDKRNE